MAPKAPVKPQLIELIEWLDDSSGTLVYRFPAEGKPIKMGAQLTVRAGQLAVFVDDGQVADSFDPGRHRLTTRNLPVLAKLRSWKKGSRSPFEAEIFFVSSRLFADQGWSTAEPVVIHDHELGPVRLRAHGLYSFKVREPAAFTEQVTGAEDRTTDEITGTLDKLIASGVGELLAESSVVSSSLVAKYDELSAAAKEKLDGTFESRGLELSKLTIEKISLPPEIEQILDERQPPLIQAAEAALASSGASCIRCFLPIQPVAAFCQHCGAPQGESCEKCRSRLPANAKFCPNCGTPAS